MQDCPPGGRLSGSLVGTWGASSAPAIHHLHTANTQEICNQTIVESLGKKQGSHAFLVLSKSIFQNALIHEFMSKILVCKLLSYYLLVSVVSSKKAKVSINCILEQIAVQCRTPMYNFCISFLFVTHQVMFVKHQVMFVTHQATSSFGRYSNDQICHRGRRRLIHYFHPFHNSIFGFVSHS